MDISSNAKQKDNSYSEENISKDPVFEVLNPGDFDDIEGVQLPKSDGSSLSSYTEVDSLPQSPGVEMTMAHSDMKKLLHEAGKESGESSVEDNCSLFGSKNEKMVQQDIRSRSVVVEEKQFHDGIKLVNNENSHNDDKEVAPESSAEIIENKSDKIKETLAQDENISTDSCSIIDEKNATLFHEITYLGSTSVNAPVSDIELKRTMAILKQQSTVAMDIVLSVSALFDGVVKFFDPKNQTVIATYHMQKILFCGRGDENGTEKDCFAFNICHGSSDVFHCHVFRCLGNANPANILARFKQSFNNKEKLPSGLVYKFDLVFDILEDDGKGSYFSVPRDKTCFKLRRDVHKQIHIQLNQLSNRLLIMERCFGVLICPGRNVTQSDMNLLEKVSMKSTDNGRTYLVSGIWDPEREDTLVLNTETKKNIAVHMTVAVDFVVSGISEPVRFLKELGIKVFPSNERFWNPSRPKIKEQYTLELKMAKDDKESEKSYEVLSLKCSTQHHEIKEILTSHPDDDVDDDDDATDEPLMSGSGEVLRECSSEQLDDWSEIMTKWRDVENRPKHLKKLIRKKGVPEPLRAKVWQMLVCLDDTNDLIESYKDLIRRESSTEQVIKWDIHRTFPGHEYFRSSEGQENLEKICRAYSVYDDEVGYCQGMSYLAAVLLLHLPEEQAFGVFVKIMYDYGHRELFLNGFEKLNERFFVLERIVEEFLPDLHSHFVENKIEPHMFGSQWFLTLFTAKFPLSLVYRVIDLYLSEGQPCIYQIATALLKVAKKDLLQLSFEGMLKYFRVSLPKRFISEEEQNIFINVTLSYKNVVKKLKRYEELYELKKEREKENENPVERLKRENKQLMLANIRLEHENDSLAHELVSNKISLREKLDKAEELADDYLREMEILQKKIPELEDENEKLRAENIRVKDLLRKNDDESVATKLRYESVIEEYKKICSNLDERSEELKSNLEQELREILKRISSCTNCSEIFTDNDNTLSGKKFKSSVKIVDADQRMKELELELAQTKLSLVEAECNVQDLEHRLSNFMSAVAAEESKPWFRRSKVGTPSRK